MHALEWLSEKQNMDRSKKYDEDIINYETRKDSVYIMVFNVHKGMLENKREYEFENAVDFLEQFLMQYYEENNIPKEIILPEDISESLKGFLEEKRGTKITITVPKIGEKKQLLELVKKNIEISFYKDEKALEELRKDLNLNEMPERIECFDISHLGGTNTVASMVSFWNGKADKQNYRRFKIRTVTGIDDFESIAEVVRRRYAKLKADNLPMPDLIIIDGGKGQLSHALEALKKLELKIPIISLAKQFEEVFEVCNNI